MINLICESTFRFTVKLSRRYSDFPDTYTSFYAHRNIPHTPGLPVTNIPHQNLLPFVITDEPPITYHSHSELISYSRVHSWCCILLQALNKYVKQKFTQVLVIINLIVYISQIIDLHISVFPEKYRHKGSWHLGDLMSVYKLFNTHHLQFTHGEKVIFPEKVVLRE